MGAGKIIGGIILLVIGIVSSSIGYSINVECASIGGQLGTLFSSEQQTYCSGGSIVFVVGVFMGIIGLVLIVVGAVTGKRRKEVTAQDSGQSKSSDKVFCRYCGKEREASGEFCSKCGRSTQSSSIKMKICFNCSSPMSEDSQFCAKCDQKFEDKSVAS
jgi:membrane protease subunit (stomatin/prohibitin family)